MAHTYKQWKCKEEGIQLSKRTCVYVKWSTNSESIE